MKNNLVAIAHLGRAGAMGEARRVQSWIDVFEAAGAKTILLPLLAEHPARVSARAAVDIVDLARGRVVPETVSWSLESLRRQLTSLRPVILVLVTARAYRPALAGLTPCVLLDFVDSLSASYRQRAAIVESPLKKLAYRVLGPLHERFERGFPGNGVLKTAAGWSDAVALGATWIPNTVQSQPPLETWTADHDILFFGTLSYPPNVEALQRLARVWPLLIERRPATTALVAGRSPGRQVMSLASTCGWTVVSNFENLNEILGRARVAVSPLTRSAGIQSKVLEAAAYAMPQVVTRVALAGFPPDFPVTVAATDEALVNAVIGLLEDPVRSQREALATQAHVEDNYSATRWASWAADLLSQINGSP